MPNLEYVGFAFFCLMIAQHILIARPSPNTETFHQAWHKYRRHIFLCHYLAIFVLVVTGVLISVDAFYVAQHNANNPIITKELLNLLNTRSYLSLTLFALLLAIIKIMAERYFEKKLLDKYTDIKDPWQKDVWLAWFIISALITVPMEYRPDIPIEPPYHPSAYFAATILVIVVLLTYVLWIHSALYRQMAETNGLIGSIIPALFRLSPLDVHPPAQALVIGPKEAGKSELIKSCDPSYREFADRMDSEYGTPIIREATMLHKLSVSTLSTSQEEEVRFALLDFPGENIGDHCTLPFDLRCDILVLVLPEEAFNPELVDLETAITISGAADIDSYFNLEATDERLSDVAGRSRDYLYALYYGLNYDGDSLAGSGPDILLPERKRSPVNSFVLLANYHGQEPMYGGEKFLTHLDCLSKQIGGKFLTLRELCFAQYQNVQSTNHEVFLEALGASLQQALNDARS